MRACRRCLKVLLALAAGTLFSMSEEKTSQAESDPALSGFSSLGNVSLDKNGCASCPAVFETSRRHRAFAFASDSPFPVIQTGRIDVTCGNGSTYHVFLNSPSRSGVFQLVSNSCLHLDTKHVTLTINSVSLSPADAERKVGLIAYGSF